MGKFFKLEPSDVCLTHPESSHCTWLDTVMVRIMLEYTHEDDSSFVLYSSNITPLVTESYHGFPHFFFTLSPIRMKMTLSFLGIGPGAPKHLRQSCYH